ncbi:unnamed protein product [Calypogeia fissa]
MESNRLSRPRGWIPSGRVFRAPLFLCMTVINACAQSGLVNELWQRKDWHYCVSMIVSGGRKMVRESRE